MAYLDAADLLARCKADAQRPTTDEDMSDAQWYSYLTEAQDQCVRMILNLFPDVLLTVPTALTTADSGLTYTFPTTPLAIKELTDGKGGRPLNGGPYWDAISEYTWEGEATIRMARNVARTFANGLYARWVIQPGVIDGSTAPTLPTMFRPLLVPQACLRYARRGGYRDPTPYEQKFQHLWSGDPNVVGDHGILGQIRRRQLHTVNASGSTPWWQVTGDIG